jgi:tRNA modification GTPase
MIISNLNDTICAISTPAGTGGIAVVRLSGTLAIDIADKAWQGKRLADCKSHTAHLGNLTDTDGSILDNCVATIYRAPHSFTGNDVVEFSIHGSIWLQRAVVDMLVRRGARIALPGEFTRRAFASGKMDLAQAEAVADMISSTSRAAHRIAVSQMRGHFSTRLATLRERLLELASLLELELDFSEEDVEFASRNHLLKISSDTLSEVNRLYQSFRQGHAIKEGIPVAIIGKTNAGKSSLLNAIIGDDKAIVSDIHGTTRDIIEDTIELGDYRFRFMDTAGIRHTTDSIEKIGIERSLHAAENAQIIIMVIDISAAAPVNDFNELCSNINNTTLPQLIVILNKSDKTDSATTDGILSTISKKSEEYNTKFTDTKILPLSTISGEGMDAFRKTLENREIQNNSANENEILITNARHAEALHRASVNLKAIVDELNNNLSGDFIAQDLREALSHLAEVTGEISTPDILASIFTRFCIGK